MKKEGKLFLCMFTLLFAACKSTPENRTEITVNGMIYDTNNSPVVNYFITIDETVECVSDIGGRFTLKNVSKGQHLLTGYGDGYLDMEQTVIITDKSQILYLRVPSIESRFEKAYEYIKEKEYFKAENCIKDILLSDENNTDALFFMGVIKQYQGFSEESFEYIRKIKEQGEGGYYVEEFEKIFSKK